MRWDQYSHYDHGICIPTMTVAFMIEMARHWLSELACEVTGKGSHIAQVFNIVFCQAYVCALMLGVHRLFVMF